MSTPLKDRGWFSVLYMFAITAFLSAVLVALSLATRKSTEVNQKIAFERSILEAVGVTIPSDASGLDIHGIYVKRIKSPEESSSGAYVLLDGANVRAYALPISGSGFWDKISGIIGIDRDRKTITGISFYEQTETPGLGGEIIKPHFRNQFKGRRIADKGDPMVLRPVGAPLDSNSVEAITGATQTSSRLMKFLNARVASWRDAMKSGGSK